nr:MAG TPA: hypothetical protein [Caudoviricetes sp.]
MFLFGIYKGFHCFLPFQKFYKKEQNSLDMFLFLINNIITLNNTTVLFVVITF